MVGHTAPEATRPYLIGTPFHPEEIPLRKILIKRIKRLLDDEKRRLLVNETHPMRGNKRRCEERKCGCEAVFDAIND